MKTATTKFQSKALGLTWRLAISQKPSVLVKRRSGVHTRWKLKCLKNWLQKHDGWSSILDIRYFIFKPLFRFSFLNAHTSLWKKMYNSIISTLLQFIFIINKNFHKTLVTKTERGSICSTINIQYSAKDA